MDEIFKTPSKCEIGANYLSISPDASKEDCVKIFDYIGSAHKASLWWIGDFLNEVEARWGETYMLALNLTDYAEQTLRNAKQVCKAFPKDQRFPLSYSHHADAQNETKKDIEKARKNLETALAQNLSVKEMRAMIRKNEGQKPKDAAVNQVWDGPLIVLMNAFEEIKRYLRSINSKTPTWKINLVKSGIAELKEAADKKLSAE